MLLAICQKRIPAQPSGNIAPFTGSVPHRYETAAPRLFPGLRGYRRGAGLFQDGGYSGTHRLFHVFPLHHLPLDDDVAELVPLLVASYIWLDDEPEKSVRYKNLYDAAKREIRGSVKISHVIDRKGRS